MTTTEIPPVESARRRIRSQYLYSERCRSLAELQPLVVLDDSAAVAIATDSCRQLNPRSINFSMIYKVRHAN